MPHNDALILRSGCPERRWVGHRRARRRACWFRAHVLRVTFQLGIAYGAVSLTWLSGGHSSQAGP